MKRPDQRRILRAWADLEKRCFRKWPFLFFSWVLLAGCQRFEPAPLSARAGAEQFAARSLNEPGLRAFMEEASDRPIASWPLRVWDFDSLTLATFYFQPSLQVFRAQWQTLQAGRETAAGRRNPVLTVAPGYSVNAAAGVSPWIPLGNVDVPIETAGKRARRIDQAAHIAEAARLNLQTAAWQARGQLRAALLEWQFSLRRAQLLEAQRSQHDDAVRLLEQRLAAGAASPYEVATARFARLQSETEMADARLREATMRAAIAQAIGIPMTALNGIDLSEAVPPMTALATNLPIVEARTRALQSRADIRAGLEEYAASEAALQLEIARQYPDVHLNPGYQFDQGEHKWSLGVVVELPVLNRNEGPIAEAEARRKEVAARFEALQARVIAEIDLAETEYRGLTEQLRRNRELLNLQEAQVRATEAAFRAGSADSLELTSARLETGKARIALADVEARERAALGRLEDALELRIPETGKAERTAFHESSEGQYP